ncbi:Ldh family oxidoreductase [Roseibaca sp. Y0-43]|uniref:Ldh family oxidoreductase n=1 Tax=Roseibaca sp. Y0-43 TaxID=2816854 RepID=UPI001D0C71C0|nr:Ldh family oxidoreductase [Roseibaca sp. Y0-43]MCC1482456.1 Ldh family oxidoreductase [Roseibaca sp. Y0-43]
MSTTTLSLADARQLVVDVFAKAGMPAHLAAPAAQALVMAEQEGLPSHGLARAPFYAAQMVAGKVVADAAPTVERDGAVIRVDAGLGLAFAAIAAAAQAARDVVAELGVAAVSVTRSHHFGVAGQAVEPFAREGLIALAFANAPAAMAPWGGNKPLYGTNPIAFAAPRAKGDPLLIDLSLSHVARGKVMLAQKAGQAIPEGWALDVDGNPTTDADAAMAGTMVPSGGAKGAALALMVELLTAGLAGAHFAYQASSLFDDKGPAPNLAHFMLVLDPARFAPGFTDRAEAIFAAIESQDGARLPGARRMAERASRADQIDIPQQLYDTLTGLARG